MNMAQIINDIDMTNWKPMSAVRNLRPEAEPLKEPFRTNAGWNDVM